MNKKQTMIVAAIVVLGLLAGSWIWLRQPGGAAASKSGHAASAAPDAPAMQSVGMGNAEVQAAKGPHGGKIFRQGEFAVEVTIYESGVPPRFRLYLFENNKPLAPRSASVVLTVSRLGAAPQAVKFTPEASYLIGDRIIDEPHSFDVAISADYKGVKYAWQYGQTEARIEMADASLKSSGIDILTAGPARIASGLKLPGEILFNSDRMVRVVPRLAGLVVALPKNIGQSVKKGDVIAIVESQALADLRSELLLAQRRSSLARTTSEREKKLWQEKISAEQDYLAARQAAAEAEITLASVTQKLRALGALASAAPTSASLTRLEIRAPIAGLIVAKDITTGEAVKEDTPMLTIADISTVWAELSVPAKDIGTVRQGQKAMIRSTATAASGSGTVSYIGALVGQQTRSAKARVTLPNPDGQWRPGLFVDVDLVAEEATVPVAVAVNAIQTVRDWSVVFGRYGQYFEARPLELGRTDGTMVEVVKGLSAGEKYGGGNSFAIKADLGKAGASHDH